MSFLKSLKRAFGFGYEYDDNDDMTDSTEKHAAIEMGQSEAGLEEEDDGLEEIATMPVVAPEMKARIFEGVLSVFNSALPDFLGKSVNPEAQKEYLVNSLDSSINDYLNSLMLEAERYAENKLKSAADASRRDAERLRSEMQQLEHQRSSLQEQQLSADRRRRALADRVNDLEGRVATAEAEREQYQLENRSLLNKLKVADVQSSTVEELNKEIEHLKNELEAAGVENLTALQEQLDDANSANENLKEQQRMHELMYNDLQQKLSEEKEARNAVQQELDKAKKYLEVVDELKEQMLQVETLIKKRDERIARLKASNKQLKQECEALTVRLTERDNDLFNIVSEDTPAYDKQQNEDIEKQNYIDNEMSRGMAAIEDDFECPDWFKAEPPTNQPNLRSSTSDDDFGYVEPVKKNRKPESDAQLSLF